MHVEHDARLAAPAGEHGEAAVAFAARVRDDALGHFALEHEHKRIVPWRPWLDGKPLHQQCGGDVVGQVGDDAHRAGGHERARIEGEGVALDDIETAGIVRGDIRERGNRPYVALDRDHPAGAFGDQRAGQATRSGPDLDHRHAVEPAAGAGDPRGEIEVEQEILAERFSGRELVTADDVPQRWQIVDRAHDAAADAAAARSLAASRAASSSAATRLDISARPVPAISKAVPWSGEVRTNGRPRVTLTA